MEFMCKGCFLWKIQGVENWNIIDLCKKYLEMSFGIFGNEFWHFGNEFCLFSGNEFRPKRAKKKSLHILLGILQKALTIGYNAMPLPMGEIWTLNTTFTNQYRNEMTFEKWCPMLQTFVIVSHQSRTRDVASENWDEMFMQQLFEQWHVHCVSKILY